MNTKNKHDQYFEGTLQLRNPNDEVINYIERRVNERDDVFIAKAEKVTNGIDFYLSSNRFLKNLGKKLQKKFKGELKLSPKLFSRNRQTSKNVYRLNVLFRLPTCKCGDIIKIRGEKIKVLKLGNKIFGKNRDTGKKVNIDYKELS
jgi:NMD protein affecting ribosome stability and mRNA decay|tara:strand:- start:368 stop:805 length:438 start_codon:yes stop_codon:yes gene_type:complete